jgi:hypothetical protein
MMSMNHEPLGKKTRSLGMLSGCDENTHCKHVKYPTDTIMDEISHRYYHGWWK